MDSRDKERIIERYDQRLDQHGVGIKALASGTDERRKLRFDVLTDIGIQSGHRVLDLGCGFGDYWTYLKQRRLNVEYLGVDINPRLVAEAQRQHPEARFVVADIEKEDLETVDWVVSTSCFNLKLSAQDNYTFVSNIMRAAYARARRGVAIDLLSAYVDFQGNPEEAFYYRPEIVFAAAKAITKRVTIRHDYPLFEFCVYLYPDFQGWGAR